MSKSSSLSRSLDTAATAIVRWSGFNVRWSGFDDSSDSWEPYTALMYVDKLHDYLRANAMKTLIPREHK